MVCGSTEHMMQDGSSSESKRTANRSIKAKQDLKKDKRTRTLIKNAKALIRDAKAQGADTTTSEELIQKAEKALEAFNYREAQGLVRNAKAESTEEKRYFRAERMIGNVLPLVDQADEMGADITDPLHFLREAQQSLQKRNFGLDSQNVKNVRNAVRRAKKRKRSQDILDKMAFDIAKSEKDRLDASKALELLADARLAFAEEKHVEVQKISQRVNKALKDAKLKRKMEDKLQSLQMDLDELKAMGGDATKGEEDLTKARQAMEDGKYSKMQNLSQRIRRWTTRARKKRETEILINAMGTLIDKASRGGKEFLDAKELVDTFKKAIMTDRISDFQGLVQKELGALEKEEGRRKSARRFLLLTSVVKDMSEHGEDTAGLEVIVRRVKRALEDGNVEEADRHMEEIGKTDSLFRFSRERARGILNKAKTSITQAQGLDVDIRDAEELIEVAENLMKSEDFLESMEKAKAAHQVAENLIPEEIVTKKKEMEERLVKIRSMFEEAKSADIDVSDAKISLEEAERAAEEGRLADAERLIEEAERLCEELASSLRDVSNEFLTSVRSSLAMLRHAGIPVGSMESMCDTAEGHHENERYQEAIAGARAVQKMITESEKSLEITARENLVAIEDGIQRARITGASVEEAEILLEDADDAVKEKDYAKHRILVEKAERSLRAAENIFLSHHAMKELEEVQSLIVEAKKIGISQVEEAEIVLRKAQEAFDARDFGIVSMLTDTAKELLVESKKRNLIQQFTGKSKKVIQMIDKAKQAAMDSSDFQEVFRQAQESFGEGDYEEALRFAQESETIAQDRIKDFIEGRIPKVQVNLPTGGVQPGTWNNYVFEIVNEGDIAAQNVKVDLRGDLEVKGLEAVARLLPQETKKLRVGLRPKQDGRLPVDVSVSFKKPFDDTNFEVKEESNLNISRLGTYLVDDVFLVHNDGRLIFHETREFKEEVDDDIFSGMLTVMQEFIKDSFGERATTGLSRMDFGDNKVVIERGIFVYLATVLTGEEPALLPLYMAEVVKEIEERFAEELNDWSGLLSELEGVEEIVRKLIFVSDDEEAEIGNLEASVITSTLEIMRDAQSVGADVSQAQDLLQKAKRLLEEQDYETAWRYVEEASASAHNSKSRLRGQIENALFAAQNAVEEARAMGLEVQGAESLLENAEEAVENFNVDEVNSIVDKVNEVVEAARVKNLESVFSIELEKAKGVIEKLRHEGVEVDEAEKLAREADEAKMREDFEAAERCLQMLKETVSSSEKGLQLNEMSQKLNEFKFVTRNAKGLGLDVSKIEAGLRFAEEAMERGEEDSMEESLKEVGELLEDVRSVLSAAEIDRYLESVNGMIEMAKSIGIDMVHAERILSDASQLGPEDVEKLRSLIGDAEKSASEMIAEYVKTRTPDIKLRFPGQGLQADVWNKCVFEILNEGNMAARNLEVDLEGDFEVKGLESISHIDSNEKKEMEVGLKPTKEGEITIDTKLYFQKYFDEEEYRLDDLQEVKVESQGTYLVEDVFLIHNDGRLIAHESRKYREEIDEDVFGGMLSVVKDFVADSFQSKGKVGLKRLDFGESKIMLENGRFVSVAAVLVGKEPDLLPLHILEVIARIEEKYGEMLDGWSGLMSDLAGIRDFIKELIFVTDKEEALTEGLKSSLVAKTFGAEGAFQLIQEARQVVETEKMDSAWDFVSNLGGVVTPEGTDEDMGYPEGTLSPEFMKELGSLAENPEFRVHIGMISEIVQKVTQVRTVLDLGHKVPINVVAIKPIDEESANVISDFKRVLQDHLIAKELVVIPPDSEWEGLDLKITVDEDRIARTYPQWSRKIQMLLKSQSPWKVKAGLDKGSYVLGIEGHSVSIDSEMVSYEISVPEHVAAYEFGMGKIYVDKTQNDELRAEGYAGEIIEEIARTKREAGLEEGHPVELKICVGDELRALLEDWMDDVVTEVRCTSFKFRPLDWKGDDEAHSVELRLGEEEIRIYLKESAEAAV